MKALTVQQPWAWAIIHGGKDVENRTQAWSYRGPLAIHAGLAWDATAMRDAAYVAARQASREQWFAHGAIIGVVDLVDVHHASALNSGEILCCSSPWAECQYDERHGGRARRDVVHLVLEHPRPLWKPIPAKGRLGLWNVTADVLVELVGNGALTGHVVA